jgi:hypothetical protein
VRVAEEPRCVAMKSHGTLYACCHHFDFGALRWEAFKPLMCRDITNNVATLMSRDSEVKFVRICARKKAPWEPGRDSYS